MNAIREEARLYAIEYMIMNVYAHLHCLLKTSPQKVREMHDAFREQMAVETFSLDDPAESDAFAAEVQQAVEQMQDGIEDILGMAKRKG